MLAVWLKSTQLLCALHGLYLRFSGTAFPLVLGEDCDLYPGLHATSCRDKKLSFHQLSLFLQFISKSHDPILWGHCTFILMTSSCFAGFPPLHEANKGQKLPCFLLTPASGRMTEELLPGISNIRSTSGDKSQTTCRAAFWVNGRQG